MPLEFLKESFRPDEGDDPFSQQSWVLTKLPIALYIIFINVVIYLLVIFLEGSVEVGNLKFGSLSKVRIDLNGEIFRFITANFLHGGNIHIFFNMLSLFMVGPFIEKIFGKINFFILYILSGLFATLSSYYFTLARIQYDPRQYASPEAVGASGAIFGVVGGLTLFLLLNKESLKEGIRKRLLINIYIVVALNLAFGFSIGGIDNAGHIGGLLAGIGIAYFLKPQIFGKKKLPIARFVSYFLLLLTLSSFIWVIWLYVIETRWMKGLGL
ncbi:MAG: hypothetical protein IEMM0008_1081 [bacterium]|nr:MAG: hypothetical protein IEMM0008_1081 [bacterium]